MAKRKVVKYQELFRCDFIGKEMKVDEHALEGESGWLCKCGRWTNECPEQHKTIEKFPRTQAPEELIVNKIDASKLPIRRWTVLYWDDNDYEHKRYIDAKTEQDVRLELNNLNIKKYSVFNDKGKNTFSDGGDVVNDSVVD